MLDTVHDVRTIDPFSDRNYLAQFAPYLSLDLRDIVFELRDMIAPIAPTATETIHHKGISYYYAERGRPVSAGICQINLERDHIRLAFNHGAFLSDPLRLLQGDRLAKRYVKITSFDQAPWDDLQDLITASAHFDPRTLAKSRRLRAVLDPEVIRVVC
jgi:hypothetical protein